MAHRTVLCVPLFVSLSLFPALAFAAPPDDSAGTDDGGVAEAAETSEPAVEVVVVTAPVAPTAAPVEEPVVDPYYEDVHVDDFDDDYDPYVDDYDYEDDYESPRTTLELQSGYVSFGIAPGMTFHSKGFHPNTRFELEFGGTLEHDYRDLALSFGVVTHMTPYYERKTPSYGADVTATALLGPVYVRTGLGALGGLPRGHLLHETMAAVGGVVGTGLSFGRAPMVRVGVDYDLRLNTSGEWVHTGFLVLRIVCCRSD